MTRIACSPIRSSAIDLSVCSANMALTSTWRVLDHPHGSDHLPILVTFSHASTAIQAETTTAIRTKSIDWEQYNNFVQLGVINKIDDLQSNTEKYLHLVDIIRESAISSSPRLPRRHGTRVPKSWWCAELTHLYDSKKRAYSAFKRIGGQTVFLAYQQAETRFRRMKCEKKKSNWMELCGTFNKDTPLAKMNTLARRFPGQSRLNRAVISSCSWQACFAEQLAAPTPCR